MSILRTSVLAFVVAVGPLAAKPLVTSSEETLARICLARTESPDRIVAACDAALTDAALTPAQRVELTVARGDGLSWQGEHEAGASSYRAATQLDPRSIDAWNGLGWALWELQDDAAAYEAFSTSLSIDVSVQGLSGTAGTGRRTGKVDAEEARARLRAALTIDPEYIWALRELGWSLFDAQDFQGAADAFESALRIDPDDVNARFGLGRTKIGLNDNEAALTAFNDLLADAPGDFATEVYRIIALRNLDRNAQALRESERMIAAYPDRASGYIEKGLSLIALQRRSQAIDTYREADARLGPNNAILYWYADALTVDGRFLEALAVIDRGLALDGADHTDHLMKSYIALELRDFETARAAAENCLATGVNDPWAHYYIAIALVHDGHAAEGLERFGRAITAGLPADRIGAFATELVSAGKYVEAAQLRLKY